MKYEVVGNTVPAVEVTLNAGESMYTQRGGMAWQTEGIKMTTNAKGGVMKSLGRMFAGESIFMSTYTAEKDEAKVAFATTVPGAVMPINLAELPEGFIIQKGAFLCAESNVETSVVFTKKFSAGLFGGEGFILQKATGNGKIFLEVDGDIIQKELDIEVQITEKDFDDIPGVDSELLKLAQVMNGKVVTNDYNLNKVAQFQGVEVLNINELANAVKPVAIPGEEMVAQVVKEGKESNQGIAYLDDGTMIVVEGGKKHIGETINVLVTSVLQTSAGRMIFGKPKN